MLKKTVSIILTILMLCSVFITQGISVQATETEGITYISGDYEYVISKKNTAEIKKYKGSATTLDIPETIDGYMVTRIDDWAFAGSATLTSITIPSSVETLGYEAFVSCEVLESIKLGSGVIEIENYILNHCPKLINITVDENNTAYDSRDNCNAIISSRNTLIAGCKNTIIPQSVTSIGSYAFNGCKELYDITRPDSVKLINSCAFYNCDNLKSVTIPSGVTRIDKKAFGYLYVDYNYKRVEGFTIYGCENTLAQVYATENDFKFIKICQTHTKKIDKAVAPTCTETGLTEGISCADCVIVFEPQEVIPATGHTTKVVGAKKATYFAKGHTGKTVCKICNATVSKGKAIAKLKLKAPKAKITGGTNKITVKYTKVTDATGFQVKYKIGKKPVTKTYNTKKTKTIVIPKLSKGSYKVQVRAFIKQGSKIANSNWTKAKSVKVK